MVAVGLQKDVWVLVCDGRKALLLQNAGDRVFPKLETRRTFEHEDRPAHELGTDAPGRAFGSGGQRSATQETDWHEQAELSFLKDVAGHLEREIAAKHVRKLILAAPARALGALRKMLAHVAHDVVIAEIDKDYVRMPVYEIERHLAKALGGPEG